MSVGRCSCRMVRVAWAKAVPDGQGGLNSSTPLQNDLGELLALLRFLMPALFGSSMDLDDEAILGAELEVASRDEQVSIACFGHCALMTSSGIIPCLLDECVCGGVGVCAIGKLKRKERQALALLRLALAPSTWLTSEKAQMLDWQCAMLKKGWSRKLFQEWQCTDVFWWGRYTQIAADYCAAHLPLHLPLLIHNVFSILHPSALKTFLPKNGTHCALALSMLQAQASTADRMRRLLSPFILRRLKSEVAGQLVPKVHILKEVAAARAAGKKGDRQGTFEGVDKSLDGVQGARWANVLPMCYLDGQYGQTNTH
eukprot:scaffold68849_cov19-Tisochrysis_lutea.AAC.1